MKKSQIVLINHQGLKLVSGIQIQTPTPPIGLAYIGAYIKKYGYNYTAIDACGEALSQVRKIEAGSDLLLQGLTPKEVLNKVPKDVKIVGLTSLFSHAWFLARNIALDIKKLYPDCKIVVGGEHPTAIPEDTLKNDFIDLVILGEGEETFLNFVQCIDKGEDYKNINGIAYKNEKGDIVKTERRARVSKIDDIPYPDWDNWSINNYIEHQQISGVNLGRGIPILGTRGCPYECTFCSNDRMWTKRFVMRSPEKIVDEMEFMKKKYNVRAFSFMDSTFIVNNRKVIEFCEALIRRNLGVVYQLPAGTRCEAINQELVNVLAKSGLEKLALAPESGSEEIRNIIKKKINYSKFINAIKMLNKSKITVGCFIVIGFPEDNKKTLWLTSKMIFKLALLGVDDITVSQFTPYPGSEIYDELMERKELEGNLEEVSDIVSFYSKRLRSYSKHLSPKFTHYAMYFMFTQFYMVSFLVRPWRPIINFFNYIFNNVEKANYIRFLSEMFVTRKKFTAKTINSDFNK